MVVLFSRKKNIGVFGAKSGLDLQKKSRKFCWASECNGRKSEGSEGRGGRNLMGVGRPNNG